MIGRVLRAHGVAGEVRVRGGSSWPSLRRVFVGVPPRELAIAAARRSDDGALVKLVGIDDRTAADALRGQEVRARRDELPPLGDDEIYLADLPRCGLFDPAGALLGEVDDVISNGTQDLLVVRLPAGGEALVPFVAPLIVELDLPGRRLICDLPAGLLEP